MANPGCEILVTDTPLRDTCRAAAAEDVAPGCGAVVDFWGAVRPRENGREIEGIDYEAHRAMAEHQLRKIGEQATQKFRLARVIIHHRIGFIAVGEPSLFLRVASLHREEAFRASQWIVSELKEKVPIWKRPRFLARTVDGERRAAESKAPPGAGASRPLHEASSSAGMTKATQ